MRGEEDLHGRPSALELLEAVGDLLGRLGQQGADPALAHQLRIAKRALEMVARELELGPGQREVHRARLASLGVASEAELARAIRSGSLEDGPALRALLREAVSARLEVSNPAWMCPIDGPADAQRG